jgi:hypothetical protein
MSQPPKDRGNSDLSEIISEVSWKSGRAIRSGIRFITTCAFEREASIERFSQLRKGVKLEPD